MQTDTPIQLAVQHHQAGRLHEAEHIYRQILIADPNNTEANYYLGIITFHFGKNDIAIRYFKKAIETNPNLHVIYNDLGKAYDRLRRFHDAVASYNKAISLKPDFVEGHCNLGVTLWDMGRIDEAIASYEKAISLKPDFAEAHYNLGLIFKKSGQRDEAIACYNRAISIKPDFAEVHRSLSNATKHYEYDDAIRAMETIYTQTGISSEQKMHLAFGLGKAFEDLNEHSKSFEFILEGNRLKRASFQYSTAEDKVIFNNIKKVFSSAFFNNLSKTGYPDETPIFILGMPRSGTTLVEQILGSHSQVYGAGELNDLSYVAHTFSSEGTGNYSHEHVSDLNNNAHFKLGSNYIEKIRKYSANAKYITDKMPNNFKLIGFIKMILPEAKVIHCIRDPMDNCLSIFKNYFSGTHKYAYDMRELGQYYKLYLDLMIHWRSIFPGFIYDIRYEDLVSDQEEQTRKLLTFCNLPWDESCLSFYKTKRRVATASTIQVSRPIYRDSVQLWKKYGSQLEPLQNALNE